MFTLPIPPETITLFLAASIALAFVPGPDNIFVITQSALNGRLAGIIVTLGLCTGLLVHTAAVALGVAAIFAKSAFAFNLLKFAGAAYLLYLAWQALRAKPDKDFSSQSSSPSLRAYYLRGVIMNITNPKVAIFFLAFLPQFTEPANGSMTIQLLFLGILFILSAAVSFGTMAWFSGCLGDWLKTSDKAQIIINRIAGFVFVALAIRLLIPER